MQLSNTASSSADRQHSTPKTYSGWALDRAIILDRACPGLLASTLYFGPARRQAAFLELLPIMLDRMRRIQLQRGSCDRPLG